MVRLTPHLIRLIWVGAFLATAAVVLFRPSLLLRVVAPDLGESVDYVADYAATHETDFVGGLSWRADVLGNSHFGSLGWKYNPNPDPVLAEHHARLHHAYQEHSLRTVALDATLPTLSNHDLPGGKLLYGLMVTATALAFFAGRDPGKRGVSRTAPAGPIPPPGPADGTTAPDRHESVPLHPLRFARVVSWGVLALAVVPVAGAVLPYAYTHLVHPTIDWQLSGVGGCRNDTTEPPLQVFSNSTPVFTSETPVLPHDEPEPERTNRIHMMILARGVGSLVCHLLVVGLSVALASGVAGFLGSTARAPDGTSRTAMPPRDVSAAESETPEG